MKPHSKVSVCTPLQAQEKSLLLHHLPSYSSERNSNIDPLIESSSSSYPLANFTVHRTYEHHFPLSTLKFRSSITMPIVAFYYYLTIFLAGIFCVESQCIAYNTTGSIVPGKINVHLVPHSHDDVGWLKTVDQYYFGGNNSIRVIFLCCS